VENSKGGRSCVDTFRLLSLHSWLSLPRWRRREKKRCFLIPPDAIDLWNRYGDGQIVMLRRLRAVARRDEPTAVWKKCKFERCLYHGRDWGQGNGRHPMEKQNTLAAADEGHRPHITPTGTIYPASTHGGKRGAKRYPRRRWIGLVPLSHLALLILLARAPWPPAKRGLSPSESVSAAPLPSYSRQLPSQATRGCRAGLWSSLWVLLSHPSVSFSEPRTRGAKRSALFSDPPSFWCDDCAGFPDTLFFGFHHGHTLAYGAAIWFILCAAASRSVRL